MYLFCFITPYVVHKPLVKTLANMMARGKLFADLVRSTVSMVERGAANYSNTVRIGFSQEINLFCNKAAVVSSANERDDLSSRLILTINTQMMHPMNPSRSSASSSSSSLTVSQIITTRAENRIKEAIRNNILFFSNWKKTLQ